MVITMKEWLTAKSELEKEYYMSRIPGDDRHVSLKKRPQKTAASRKQAAECAAVSEFKTIIELAQGEYHDPMKRAEWAAEYEEYQRKQRKYGKDPLVWQGKHIPTLWAYIQLMLRVRRKVVANSPLNQQ